jgi:hypothetical protein
VLQQSHHQDSATYAAPVSRSKSALNIVRAVSNLEKRWFIFNFFLENDNLLAICVFA